MKDYVLEMGEYLMDIWQWSQQFELGTAVDYINDLFIKFLDEGTL